MLGFVFAAMTNALYPPEIDNLLPGQPVAQAIIRLATVVAITGFFTLPFLFPDGRFVPRWSSVPVIYLALEMIRFVFLPDLRLPGDRMIVVEAISTVIFLLLLIYAVLHRYRRVSTPVQRRQTRWVMLGFIVAVPSFILADAMMRNVSASPAGLACMFGFLILMQVAMLLPPVTIGIAILHHRLFDIDVLLSRTLVWLIMAAAVAGTYIGVVLGIGSLVGSRGNLLLSLLATGLVAVGAQPAYLRAQRVTRRILFGDRDDPYSVLARLGHRIEGSLNPQDLLPDIVRTTAELLRLPYAALFLERGEGPVLVAASGTATSTTLRLPLTYQGQAVGTLEVAPRTPGEPFDQADRQLLEDLARQVGVAAHTVSLAEALQHSRERIVASREEERRRLRRDLHDGLGADLAALTMQAGAARALIRRDPDGAEREIDLLRAELRASVAEVRRLVQGLRPPALDEFGLIGALHARLGRFERGGAETASSPLRIEIVADDPLPSLSAATEVAAYRIIEEAVTNVVKHAAATTARITLRADASSLLITITDDGRGPAGADGSGLGLQSMRERATELGGDVAITHDPAGGGTLVQAHLPIMPGIDDERLGADSNLDRRGSSALS
jgi:signal transduction histidine kinase